MTNNFDTIAAFLKAQQEPGTFYQVQVIKRRKENPDMAKAQEVIKVYYVNDAEYLLKKQLRIANICKAVNARAYINLNKRSYEKTAIQMIKYLADAVYNKQHEICKHAFDKVAGRNAADTDKKWILDVDTKSLDLVKDVLALVAEQKPIGNKLYFVNPTPNGFHIICKPFDPRALKATYPDVEIKKDNPTILYAL